MFAQDSWKPRGQHHGGLRHPLLTVPTDHRREQRPHQLPAVHLTSPPTRRRAPTRRARSSRPGTGDPLNGIIVAGRNSPFGKRDLRVRQGRYSAGESASPGTPGPTAGRSSAGSYGVYYDQALVGIFEQNRSPPAVCEHGEPAELASLESRRRHRARRRPAVNALIGNGDDFKDAAYAAVERRRATPVCTRAAPSTSATSGGHGDHLIRPIDVNYPQPADVLRLGSVNLARPYQGYGAIHAAHDDGAEQLQRAAREFPGTTPARRVRSRSTTRSAATRRTRPTIAMRSTSRRTPRSRGGIR